MFLRLNPSASLERSQGIFPNFCDHVDEGINDFRDVVMHGGPEDHRRLIGFEFVITL